MFFFFFSIFLLYPQSQHLFVCSTQQSHREAEHVAVLRSLLGDPDTDPYELTVVAKAT